MMGERGGAIGQPVVIGGLFTAWALGVSSFAGTIALGVILGFAGASFAIALPLASRWYPPEHQGKVMGLAGMGNSGTVLAALFAPTLAKMFGWNAVLGLACIPLAIVFILYMAMAKDAPNAPARLSIHFTHRMEQDGLLRASWGTTETNREARFYELTALGRKQLEVERESWARLTEGVGRVLRYA